MSFPGSENLKVNSFSDLGLRYGSGEQDTRELSEPTLHTFIHLQVTLRNSASLDKTRLDLYEPRTSHISVAFHFLLFIQPADYVCFFHDFKATLNLSKNNN
ncbi:unnamed protein product [Orchesella dallaii]|uniref:Uncharacterized protein n=1 Tax=Orchesella dallaii TaxID=48710 RepID=A0ABP1R8U7_9HEXA